MKSSIGLLVTAVLLASLLAAGASAPAAGASSTVDVGNLTASELRQGGTQPANAPPSLRWLGRSNALYVDYESANPLKGGGGASWKVENLLEAGALVNTDELRFHLQGVRSTGNTTYTVHLVYWEQATRQYETQSGEIVERTTVVNATHATKRISFAGPWSTSTIELRSHYNDAKRVTMWIEGYRDTARWTFNHRTLATSKQVTGIDTAGDLAWWTVKNILVWILVFGLIAAAGSMWAVRRAGGGPQMGFAVWTLLIGLIAFVALLFGYSGIASLISRAPKVLAFITVGLLTVPLIEGQDDRVKRLLAIQPKVTDATSAAGKEAQDALTLRMKSLRISERDGETIRLSPGPLKFLARVLGGYAPIGAAAEKLKTRVDAEGTTTYKEVVWIDPQAEEIEHYEKEGFDLTIPSTIRGALTLIGAIGATGVVIYGTLGTGWVWMSIFAGLPIVFSVRSGEADLNPASVHERSAHVTAMTMGKEIQDAQTLEESLQETYKERAKSSQEVEERVELRDETVVAEMLGAEVPASVADDAEPVPDGGDEE